MRKMNKDGQAIGRKGAESRARLLAAALRLIAATPAEALTASAIAREAGLASQTFYLYFKGVDEALLCLSREASEDTGEIVLELDRPWNADQLRYHAECVVSAFYRYWDRHRAILNIRNFRADSGQEAFAEVRNVSAVPIVTKIATRIRAAHGENLPTEREAMSRAIIIFSAIERMAARYAYLPGWQSFVDSEDLKRAEAEILTLLISPARAI